MTPDSSSDSVLTADSGNKVFLLPPPPPLSQPQISVQDFKHLKEEVPVVTNKMENLSSLDLRDQFFCKEIKVGTIFFLNYCFIHFKKQTEKSSIYLPFKSIHVGLSLRLYFIL